MSPVAVADLENSSLEAPKDEYSSVFPSPDADVRLKKLWAQHGDVQSTT